MKDLTGQRFGEYYRYCWDKTIMYASREAGIKSFAETYSFNIESILFNQLTLEQQELWRKEIENAVISGGEMGLELADDKRYEERVSSEDRINECLNWDKDCGCSTSSMNRCDACPRAKWVEAEDKKSARPASDDLDFLVISLEETIGTSPHSREVIKEYLQKAAEWGRNHFEDKSEMVSEDLEEACDNYYDETWDEHGGIAMVVNNCHDIWFPSQATSDFFKAGSEWQRKKDQEIDKLTESPDLDEASWKYSDRDGITYGQRYAMQIDFKAGAKWQKQQMKEAIQTEYEKGRHDMIEEMMKDAVGGVVHHFADDELAAVHYNDPKDTPMSMYISSKGLSAGDKVKIIIVKEEQQ